MGVGEGMASLELVELMGEEVGYWPMQLTRGEDGGE